MRIAKGSRRCPHPMQEVHITPYDTCEQSKLYFSSRAALCGRASESADLRRVLMAWSLTHDIFYVGLFVLPCTPAPDLHCTRHSGTNKWGAPQEYHHEARKTYCLRPRTSRDFLPFHCSSALYILTSTASRRNFGKACDAGIRDFASRAIIQTKLIVKTLTLE